VVGEAADRKALARAAWEQVAGVAVPARPAAVVAASA